MVKIVEFFRETRREVAKVTWPTQRETTITTGLIIAMALMAGVFFFFADNILGFIIGKILGMRS